MDWRYLMKHSNTYLPYLLPLRCIVFLLVFIIGAFAMHKNMEEISNWWSLIASLVNLVTILVLLVAAKRQGSNYWNLINFQKGKTTGKQM